MRVLPLIKIEEVMQNGKLKSIKTDNVSNEEIKNMSCELRMLWKSQDDIYVSELPLAYRDTNVKMVLCFVFDELNNEEKVKYFDRTTIVPTTKEEVVTVYGEKSRNLFYRKKRM